MKRWIFALVALCGLMSSCSSGWTEDEKATFKQSCQGAALMAGDQWPERTCDCLATKLEAEYPNPNAMASLLDSLRVNPVLLFDKYPECRIYAHETPAEWSPQATTAFMSSCTNLIGDSAKCACILDKAKKRLPTVQKLTKLNAQTMQLMAEECDGKRPAQLY